MTPVDLLLDRKGMAERVARLRRAGNSWLDIALDVGLGKAQGRALKEAMRGTGLLDESHFGKLRGHAYHQAESRDEHASREQQFARQSAFWREDDRDLTARMFGDPPSWRSALAARTGEMPDAIAAALREGRT